MKVILVARKALAAYLMSSEVRPVDEHQRRCVQVQRAIDLRHHRLGALVLDADDDAVGALEILDRRAFAQEFGIGDDVEIRLRVGLADDALDLVAGADRHGRLGDDHRIALERLADRRAPPR